MHHQEIAKKKQVLDTRWEIIRMVRQFFYEQNFQEVETPVITAHGGQEPYLSPMQLDVVSHQGKGVQGYLHTSPEYSLKKMLAAGYERIFSLGKCFRNEESFGGMHNPEFTMLEWYRAGVGMHTLMDDCEALVASTCKGMPIKRVHMRDLWQETVGVHLDEYLTVHAMRRLCEDYGFQLGNDEPYEDLFYRMFLNHIEPKLSEMGAVIVHHFPVQMAALAAVSEEDPRYAERFELYIDGQEIANAFTELTDGAEQRKRFVEEQRRRKSLGKPIFPIDENFIAAVDSLPNCAGIALGIDRLVMVATGCQNIDDVLVLPASTLWKQSKL